MSIVSGISPASYAPASSQVKPTPEKPHLSTPTVQPVVQDADGDNDGSKGGKIDIHA
jgi:hypothetical protein